jgi:circadian clock protein KaiC
MTPPPSQLGFLDDILAGGYASNRAHLVEGRPGQAKPPSVSILLDGLRQGERCSSSASFCPWRTGTVGHWTAWRSTNSSRLSWASIPSSSSLIHTSALELGETVHMVLAEVGRVRPSCVVFDSLFEIRLLSQGSLRYRRQVLADTEQEEARKRGWGVNRGFYAFRAR